MQSKAELRSLVDKLTHKLNEYEAENAELKREVELLRSEYNRIISPKDPPKFYISSEKYLAMIEYVICTLMSSGEGLGFVSSLHLLSDMRKLGEKPE